MSMPHVDLIRAAHEVVKAYGLGNAKNGGQPFRITVPVLPGTVDPGELIKIAWWLEFVHWAGYRDGALHVDCYGEDDL